MIDAHVESAAGNMEQLTAIAKAVAQGAAASGLELNAMELTEEGFVKAKGRKRSDASDAAGDAAGDGDAGEEQALAATTPQRSPAQSSANYALSVMQ
jgi:hypothetical protein